ncbi:MAG: ABC transporter substrate-binding protein [Actinomycetota bacterium]|nr:ABC transporter substrate-binding protein [Actinomycetota bacterium]
MRIKLVTAVAVALVLAACGDKSQSGQTTDQTFVFGMEGEPTVLDGARSTGGPAARVGSQIFEGLLTVGPKGDLRPSLAKSWERGPDGRSWSFQLQEGVQFHDGSPFDAGAVCSNFDRWYHSKGILQTQALSIAWRAIFGGFATRDDPSAPAESLYESCQPKGTHEVVINLTRPSGRFLPAMTYWQFTMASPDALQRYGADQVSGTAQAPKFDGTFGREHAIGTGPFKLEQWVPNDRVVLVRNDDYWGDKAKLDRVIFRPIPDNTARRQSLEAGEIHGYEPVEAADIAALEEAGIQIVRRQPINVAFIGFNQQRPPMDNLKIRQAVAHALDREAVLKAKYPPETLPAKEFIPPTLMGYADDVVSYDYDPAEARRLIAESGVPDPVIEFWYPTGASTPYIPDPEGIFEAFRSDLEEVGFRVVGKPEPLRPNYPRKVLSGEAQMFLISGAADLDPDSFLNLFFGQRAESFGFDNPELFALVKQGDLEVDQGRRDALYKRINRMVMEILPGVPLVHVRPAIALAKDVQGYEPHPVDPRERLTTVSLD